ncbi:hypothetical protein ACQKMD_17115 [Viridibacillus sp. NPDC096237]|uniref:hypothetical protein n=1 Tax=Viridibacillus sp. NPDC096237 TaxID=3390721 RepID=UPI003CFFF61C
MALEKIIKKCIESATNYGVSAYEVVVNSRKTNKLYDYTVQEFKLLKSILTV